MNSIAKAINNVAIALSRIAVALENNRINPTPAKPLINATETSNPLYSKVTSTIKLVEEPNYKHKHYNDIWKYNR